MPKVFAPYIEKIKVRRNNLTFLLTNQKSSGIYFYTIVKVMFRKILHIVVFVFDIFAIYHFCYNYYCYPLGATALSRREVSDVTLWGCERLR